MYSTIKPKKGCCPDCGDGSEKYLTAGRCQHHHKKYKSLKKEAERKEKDLGEGNESFQQFLELDKWFKLRVSEMKGVCAECGGPTSKNIYKYAICSVAHIFPKSKFKSIATHPLNWMELGAMCGCHSKSEDYEKAMTMKIWPEMLRRIKILVPEISAEERKYIPDIILQEIEPK